MSVPCMAVSWPRAVASRITRPTCRSSRKKRRSSATKSLASMLKTPGPCRAFLFPPGTKKPRRTRLFRGAGRPGSVFDVTHGGGVEAAVDVEDLAADARSQIGAQEGCRVADFLDGHVAAQRGLALVGGEHLAEALDAGGGQGADRAGGDGVDASAFRAKAAGQVADAGFQAGL